MQRTWIRVAILAGLALGVAATAAAQGRDRAIAGYPSGFRPPPGMCRVWIQGVPPGRQPGVTDCASARASAPANARVLYGDRGDDPAYRGRVGTYSRTVYDAYGNRVTQRLRRNADGSVSVISSTPYGSTPVLNGKRLPRTGRVRGEEDDRGSEKGRYKRDHEKKDHEKDHDNL